MRDVHWLAGFQVQEWFNMLVRFEGGDFTELLNEHDRFILLVYFDGQQFDPEDKVHFMSILPSTHPKFERCDNYVIMDMFSAATFVETYHSESYDMVNHFGISYDDLWDEENKIYRPIIISVEKGWIKDNSYGKCYCSETYTDVIYSIYPELFEPPSVSES